MDDLCRGRYSESGEAKGNVKCEMRVNASGKELGCARLVLSLATGDAVVGLATKRKEIVVSSVSSLTPRESLHSSRLAHRQLGPMSAVTSLGAPARSV